MKLRIAAIATGLVSAIGSVGAYAFSSLYVFGDSFSDGGNNAIVFKQLFSPDGVTTPVPISDNKFVPTFPYQSAHYTNGDIWTQSFATALGLKANPSLGGGTNFAYGGARTSGGTNPPAFLTVVQQKDALLSMHPHIASDALYVVESGGNNARDALEDIKAHPLDTLQIVQATAQGYASDVKGIVQDLENAGARDIVVWNVPDVGKAPALSDDPLAAAGATSLAEVMNHALNSAIRTDPHVKLFDFFGIVDTVVDHPGQFGLTNVTDACARFTDCDPTKFLFWDGIHPTSAAHEILSDAMLQLVPEPSTYACVIAGLIACYMLTRRRMAQAVQL